MSSHPPGKARSAMGGVLLATLLTPAALLVHGYHPFSEDGGVYVAGIERLLHPALFPVEAAFVTEHLRFSLFAPLLALLTRTSHLSLDAVLFAVYLASVWATLFTASRLAALLTDDPAVRTVAVTLLGCTLTTPVAGTSLVLVDPYLTARSLSTPLGLLAATFALEALTGRNPFRRWMGCAMALAAAAALHPLMAGYSLAWVVLLAAASVEARQARWAGYLVLGAMALGVAAWLQLHAPAESPAYQQVVWSRYYWFPRRWEWYEQFGLIAPLLIFAALLRRRANSPALQVLLRGTMALSCIALAVAAAFCRNRLPVHAVARMQPLRCFQTTYLVLIVLLGMWLAEGWLRNRYRAALLLLPVAVLMFFCQRSLYPASQHLELPDRAPTNPWEQAFLWVRRSTPVNAVFALDAHYITRPGEDAQCFRALSERSALPDFSKDGGETSITPELADEWQRGVRAQEHLASEPDAERIRRLSGTGARWLVLPASSATALPCPYRNDSAKVCMLP